MQALRDRLDSWKAIADYLRRDERTVRRWEKSLGLPVRRVPGGRGHSVFAYVSEIDAWLQARSPRAEGAALSDPSPSDPASSETAASTAGPAAEGPASPVRRLAFRWPLVAAAALAIVVLNAVRPRTPGASEDLLALTVDETAVVARDGAGTERWRHVFPTDERTFLPEKPLASVLPAPAPGVLVATSSRQRLSDRSNDSGQLMFLSLDGRLERAFQFDDRLTFDGVPFEPPWAITDVRTDVRGGTRITAVAAHHFQWWPGLVTVLDDRWQRRGTFVNAGWVESIDWLADGRLLAAGFSNARDGGMVAVLDTDAPGGQSPEAAGPFHCDGCDSGGPVRYIVMPRSELNRVTASRFNRAIVQILIGGVLVRTTEADLANDQVADAIYEFSPSMELRRASYSDRYWDLHRALEIEGLIDHDRSRCPERDGPRAIQVWEPAAGWREVAATRPPATP